MARYEKYKDSGEQWLGQVPDHWEIIKGRGVFEENVETNKDLSENTVLSLSYGKIIKKRDINEGLVPADYRGYQIVNPNYIIIRCTDLQNDKVSLRTAISKYRGIITGAYLGLIVKPKYNPDFMHYYLHTWDITKEIYRHGGGLRQVLSWEDVKYLTMLIPPKDEQNAIVSYLDSACEEIDKAIAQQQRMIDLLNERKQIIIQNAVTKGLDPNVPMKDSGIEWIGKIPAHWELKHLRNFLTMFSEKGHPDATLLSVTREQGVILRSFDIEENHNFIPDDLSGYKHVRKGDFVINKMKSWQGSYGLSDYDGIVSPAYFTCKLNSIDNKQFFSTAIRCKAYTHFFMQYSKGIRIGQWDLDPASMKAIPFILPPKDEQQPILDHIADKTAQIVKGIASYEKNIELLQERKRIIINDVVTGKIKVS